MLTVTNQVTGPFCRFHHHIHQVLVGSCLPGKPLKLNVSQLGKSPRGNMTIQNKRKFLKVKSFCPCVEVATSPKAFRNVLPVWCRSHFWHQVLNMIKSVLLFGYLEYYNFHCAGSCFKVSILFALTRVRVVKPTMVFSHLHLHLRT